MKIHWFTDVKKNLTEINIADEALFGKGLMNASVLTKEDIQQRLLGQKKGRENIEPR